jgi:hypothetical protein
VNYEELADPATRTLADALLAQSQILARKRWALLQLTLWQERGWVEALPGAGEYRLTPHGRQQLQHALLELTLCAMPDADRNLQHLDLQLPSQVHRHVLASLLHGSRSYRWRDEELTTLAAEGVLATQDGLLRIRGQVPFNLFFTQGGLLDATPQLALLGEVILPQAAIEQLHKVLWSGAPPQQIITVESRAAFVTLQPTAGQLLLLTPPEHTGLTEKFLATLTPNFVWGHLGDLHPQALLRQQALATRLERPLRLLLPAALPELVIRFGQLLSESTPWLMANMSSDLQLALAPLINQQRWLEHEAMALFVRDQLSGAPL